MVLAIVIAIAVIGFAATYVIEARGKRREQALAEGRPDMESANADGLPNPIVSEAVYREAHRGDGQPYV
jgi:hypothetical protein